MKAISLFSGVGGFDLGLERAGIETVLQAEIDPWCNKVLSRHWPNTRRVEDVRCVHNSRDRQDGTSGIADGHRRSGEDEGPGFAREQFDHGGIDLVYGGFPCQDLSVAGKRAGLGGERSGLWFEFHRVLSELRPRWALIENVPGLLSSNGGRDFGVLLDGLDELGFDVAWAVLDAQHFGVPQRRRRVFIVGGPTRRSVEQVLSLCESCGGNPETGRAPGEGVAYSLTAGVRGTGDGHGNAWNSNYVTAPTLIGGADGRGFRGDDGSNSYAIRTANTGANGHGIADDVAHTLDGANGQAVLASSVSASAGHHGHSSPRGDGNDNLVVAATVKANTVRRLTPLECERLQGWPDDWTRWAADGSELPDSHRYRMIGNGVASPVAEWIGHRLMAVEK